MGNSQDVPVLIAGGGPVGMALALNLARYGVRSMLVERNPTTTRHPKMDLTNGRSMELFHRLGLDEKLRDAGVPRENAFDILWVTSMVGHDLHRFPYPSANEKTDIIRSCNDGSQGAQAPLRVSQIEIEPVLKRAIDESPLVDVRFGTRFESIIDNGPDGVVAEIANDATGEAETVNCAYLAGCDGGRSRVRACLGINLQGDENVAGAYMVHFRTNDAELLQRWGPVYHLQSGSGTIIAQNDKDIYTLQAWLTPDSKPDEMTPEQVLEGWVGKPFEYEILQANPWFAHFVVAERYREGNVLLGGDSAHQYIPTGGYGMNSGIADAAAMAWVLAARLHGWGGDKLLTAYDLERRPTAWWHLEASRRHMGVRIQISGLYQEAGDLEAQGPEADARRAELARKIEALGNAENESWGVEFGYRYDQSPIVAREPNPPAIDPIVYQPTTWPGARLPHVFLADGESLYDKLGLYFTLVVLDGTDTSSLEAVATERGVPLDILRLERRDLRPIYERNLLLVRPDQHVAWRGDALPDDTAALLDLVVGR
ncbi:FAD-dependent monooxygenase [Novosphingobium sp. 9U]|uniref:FAD-dependent monooxygenase n=1 Tax=Novosphingobium sp. 9U TaxID=2653158 RepID=UPI0012F3D06C|nr:FAD-dependent monooxygenase [Novosphingobium sp. 9U]VWX50024.1 Putative 2,4-dihydroxybenzoate monooxygenase [Novosphingobium sp. 9U]